MKKILYRIIMVLLIGIMLISSYFIYKNRTEDKIQENIYEEIIEVAKEKENKEENEEQQE